MKAKVTKVTLKKGKRKPKIPSGWEERFLDTLRDWPNVTQAARKIGVSRMEVYRTRRENTDFARRFDEARRIGIDALEDSGFDLARSNPTMMIFMLKNLKPDTYADRSQVDQINLDVSQLNDEQLARLAKGDDIRSIIATSGAGRIRAAQANQDAADNA